MGSRLDSQDVRIEQVQEVYAEFHRNFVGKEDWLREAGNNRIKLDHLANMLNRMDGKMDVMEKLPAICGSIAREITKEMKGVQQ